MALIFCRWSFSQALSKTLTVDELVHLKQQFLLLEPNKNGTISLDNIKAVCLLQNLIGNHFYDFANVPDLYNRMISPGPDEICNRCHEGGTHS